MHEKKPLSAGKKLMLVLTLVTVGILLLYIGAGVAARATIRTGLEEMAAQLQAQTGAKNVKIQIFADPGDPNIPFLERFHVYLTVQMADLKQISEGDALRVLRNGEDIPVDYEVDYGYEWRQLDYAVYTRTVKDYLGVEHPVFVTISDGRNHYSLERGSRTLVVCGYHAVTNLKPPLVSTVTLMIGLFAAAELFLAYFVFKKEREYLKWYIEREKLINAEVRKIREERKKKK